MADLEFQHLSQFELKQICYFISLTQTNNNFTATAAKLGIRQPPLTQSIQALEKLLSDDHTQLAVQLFDRTRRPIVLTKAGEVFLEEVSQALSHLDGAILQARKASRGEIGSICVGINNAIANTILPKILPVFQARFPGVEVKIIEVTIEQEVQMLKNHQLDVIFQRSPRSVSDDDILMSQPIVDEHFVVALPSDHMLAKHQHIALIKLENDDIILPPLDSLPFYKNVVTLCEQAGFTPKINQSVNVTGVVALLSLVAAGVGVSILPNHVETLKRDGVVYRPLQDTSLNRQISIVWRQNDSSTVLCQFLKVIEEVTKLQDSW
jgi:DNA-binding transcriptional LysR family regulator